MGTKHFNVNDDFFLYGTEVYKIIKKVVHHDFDIDAANSITLLLILNSQMRKELSKIINGENSCLAKSFFVSNTHSQSQIIYYGYTTDDLIKLIKKIITLTKNIIYILNPENQKKTLLDIMKQESMNQLLELQLKEFKRHFDRGDSDAHVYRSFLSHSKFSIRFLAGKLLGKEGIHHLLDEIIVRISPMSVFYSSYLNKVLLYLEERGETAYCDKLSIIYKKINDSNIQERILQYFMYACDPTVNNFLISELENETPLKRDIIDALASCGTVETVEALRKHINGSYNPFIISKVKDAIAQIQSRLGDVDKGWVSMSIENKDEGKMSITENEQEGALSFDENNAKDKK